MTGVQDYLPSGAQRAPFFVFAAKLEGMPTGRESVYLIQLNAFIRLVMRKNVCTLPSLFLIAFIIDFFGLNLCPFFSLNFSVFFR